MPCRSIGDPHLIHRFPSGAGCPALTAAVSLLFLMSSSPSRASFCATFAPPIAHTALTQGRAIGVLAKGLCLHPMPRGAATGLHLIHFFEAGRRRLTPRVPGRDEGLRKMLGGANAPLIEQAEDSQAGAARSPDRAIGQLVRAPDRQPGPRAIGRQTSHPEAGRQPPQTDLQHPQPPPSRTIQPAWRRNGSAPPATPQIRRGAEPPRSTSKKWIKNDPFFDL